VETVGFRVWLAKMLATSLIVLVITLLVMHQDTLYYYYREHTEKAT
jgi:hypothetical protein